MIISRWKDYKRALLELTRIAKATVIISVPYNEAIEKNVDTCPQCRTVFNRDLHLRSFNHTTFVDLLSDFGFRMEENSVPVVNTHYLGFPTYYKLKRMIQGVPDQFKLFHVADLVAVRLRPGKSTHRTSPTPEPTRSAAAPGVDHREEVGESKVS